MFGWECCLCSIGVVVVSTFCWAFVVGGVVFGGVISWIAVAGISIGV